MFKLKTTKENLFPSFRFPNRFPISFNQFLSAYKKGYVTITVLILMMVLVAITYLFAEVLFSELAIARNNKGAQVAFSLAEAGVQEAIYRVQYDETAQDVLMSTTPGVSTQFSHDPALLDRGSYEVTITNVSKGAAIVTTIGRYTIGLRTAKREIKVDIAQATQPGFPYDSGIYGAGSGAGQSIADVDFWYAPVKIYNGSVLSNRDINFKFGADVDIEKTVEAGDDVIVSGNPFPSHVDCNCLFVDDEDPETPQCETSPGCTPIEGALAKEIPQIDFEAYKSIAQNTPGSSPDGNQYFTDQDDFKELIPLSGSATFEGVVYIDDKLDIDWFRTINMNGIIAATGTISVDFGQLLIQPPTVGGPSGVLSQRSFNVKTLGHFSGTGLVYAGDRFEIEFSLDWTMELTGGIISRRTWIKGLRETNIYFDATVIDLALGSPSDTPVIELNHWEEEY